MNILLNKKGFTKLIGAKLILGLASILGFINPLEVKAQASKNVFIAFYNQENLFDTIDNEKKIDEEYLPSSKLVWNTEKYQNKMKNMSQVILAMNEGKGPDFLGMCEVETEVALADLCKQLNNAGNSYKYVFQEGPDERGIDNGFIYKSENVKSLKGNSFVISPENIGGDHTRNILMADVKLMNGSRLVFLVNHFPSRREGQAESEFKRIAVASRLKAICDSLTSKDKKVNIVLLGDFNDHPNDKSMSEVLGGKSSIGEVKTDSDYYNSMWLFHQQGLGSHKYKGEWGVLDQILVNKTILEGKGKVKYKKGSAGIFKEEFMLETEAKYKGNPKRTFVGNKYLNGYSDHLPVYIQLEILSK
jgi:predicted extracellular nuclease